VPTSVRRPIEVRLSECAGLIWCPLPAVIGFVSGRTFPMHTALAIDFLAMSDAEDEHDQAGVFDLADKPVITHAVFPELPKS
jgi:hypothetical protein